MFNFVKNFFVYFMFFVPFASFGYDNCLRFKYDVDVDINNPEKEVVNISSSDEVLVGKLGYTISKIAYEYRLILVPIRVDDGYCVSLRGIDIDVFFPEFKIVIDKRLKPKTCSYDVVLKHEKDHMNVHKKVLNDNIADVKRALVSAVKNAIKPVFVETLDKQDDIQQDMIKKIENYKSVAQIQEKISKVLEEENKKIDTRGDEYEVWKCKEFYEEMLKSGENIRID